MFAVLFSRCSLSVFGVLTIGTIIEKAITPKNHLKSIEVVVLLRLS
jgi:hypothetical protein